MIVNVYFVFSWEWEGTWYLPMNLKTYPQKHWYHHSRLLLTTTIHWRPLKMAVFSDDFGVLFRFPDDLLKMWGKDYDTIFFTFHSDWFIGVRSMAR